MEDKKLSTEAGDYTERFKTSITKYQAGQLDVDIESLRQQPVSAECGLEVFSQDYLEWVKQANLPPLTNAQHKFAEWLLIKDNAKVVSQIGDLDTIFCSVRKWLKNGA